MVYEYAVKKNGKIYWAGEDVPDDEPVKEVKKSVLVPEETDAPKEVVAPVKRGGRKKS